MVSTLKVNKIQIPNSDSDIISLDASTGNITLAAGKTLTGAAGSIVAPGQVVQTVVSSTNTPVSIASSSFVSTNHAVTITPKFSNSKILLTVFGGHGWNGNNVNKVRVFTIYRGSTDLGHGTGGIWTHYCNAYNAQPHAGSVLDSPNTTSATTYTVYGRGQDTSSHHYAVSIGGSGTSNVTTVTFTAMEIAQ